MVGPVLDPTNYKPETYMELLNQRRKVLYNNLQDMGVQPEQIKKLSAQRPYESFGGAAPVQKATEAEVKAYADKYFKGDTTKASDDLKRKGFL